MSRQVTCNGPSGKGAGAGEMGKSGDGAETHSLPFRLAAPPASWSISPATPSCRLARRVERLAPVRINEGCRGNRGKQKFHRAFVK